MFWVCGPRGNVAGARSRSLSGETGPARTTALPGEVRHSDAVTRSANAGLALSAATICAAVLVIAPAVSVARPTRIALPVTLTVSGASRARRG